MQELGFELLPHPPYSPEKFCADEEVIEETEAYFEAKDKSYYKNGIEKLYDLYNRCIPREGNYIE